MGFHHSALEEYQRSLHVAEEDGYKSMAAAALVGLGLVNSELGEHQKAEEQFRRALSMYDAMELNWRDRQNRGSCYNNLGMNYEYQGRYQEAKGEFERMVRVGLDEKNMAHEEIGRVNLARAQAVLGDIEEAKENVKIVEELDHQVNSQDLLGGLFLVKALISVNEKDIAQAREHYARASELVNVDHNSTGHAVAAYIWGKALTHMGYENEAVQYFEEASVIFWDLGNTVLATHAEELSVSR